MINRHSVFLWICIVLPTFAQADMPDVSCDDSIRMTETLKKVIGAERHASRLRDPETMLEVWVTARNGDWVIVQSYANGTSCIVAMGEHWERSLANPA